MAGSPEPHPGDARTREVVIAQDAPADRLDRALARALPEAAGLSRSRIARLIEEGAVTDPAGRTVAEPRRKVKPGERYRLALPEPAPAAPAAEAIPLSILHEDADLLVVDKPAGMVVHPAPGAGSGTLVNALLAHCGDTLPGIGGERRPGIVHRIDKDTSGLLVVAKTEAALAALAAQFAAHSIDRRYYAVLAGAPSAADPRLRGLPAVTVEADGALCIDAPVARHPTDRKRMAVRPGGRRAVTRIRVLEVFGPTGRPAACLADCRLETGRTHQIRVHAAHVGHPLVGDPVYGRARTPGRAGLDAAAAAALAAFPRQALHAARLGFAHPRSGARLVFESPLPDDLADLSAKLRRSVATIR